MFRKLIYFALAELVILAGGQAMTGFFPDWSPYIWSAVAALTLVVMLMIGGHEIWSKTRARTRLHHADSKPDSILDDMETFKLNPGNGWLAGRLIMVCSTMNEVDTIFESFNSAPHKTSKDRVFAARALKKNCLLNRDDQDSDWWWDFFEEHSKLGGDDGSALNMILALEKEFPVTDEDQSSKET